MQLFLLLSGWAATVWALFAGEKPRSYPSTTITPNAPTNYPPQPAPIQNIPAADPHTGIHARDIAPHTFEEMDLMARTLWGEARNEGYTGMQAVANVIMNRYKAGRFGRNLTEIITSPMQFSAWNANDPNRAKMLAVNESNAAFRVAKSIAYLALKGELQDVTGGADHYLNIEATRAMRGGSLPSWVNLTYQTADIGRHTFLRLG